MNGWIVIGVVCFVMGILVWIGGYLREGERVVLRNQISLLKNENERLTKLLEDG